MYIPKSTKMHNITDTATVDFYYSIGSATEGKHAID